MASRPTETGDERRRAATAIAITVVVATLITLLLNALFGPDDPFERIERLEAGVAEQGAAIEALATQIGEFRAELAEAREAVLSAREEATEARREALQAREEAAAGQRTAEEALAAARQPPQVTVLPPEVSEPQVVVEPAEPRVAVEAAEPRVSVVMPDDEQTPGAGAPGGGGPAPRPEAAAVVPDELTLTPPPPPLALRAGDLIGSTVVNGQGETVGEITDIVRSRDGSTLFAVVEVGGLISEVVSPLGGKEVAIVLDAFEPGAGDDEVILPGISEQELRDMPAYEEGPFEPLPR